MGRISHVLITCVLAQFFALGICIVQPEPAFAEQRIALVIGNGAYSKKIGVLGNPINDAALMAESLRELNFEVSSYTDLDQRGMRRAIRDFGKKLDQAGKEGVGLFYFAGHGVQTQGTNYLIPVGAEIKTEADMAIEAVPADGVLAQMEYAGPAVNIIILDACRNNPFDRGFRSSTNGLARMDAPTGSLVAYSTAPGEVAADGEGRNSPYTRALAQAMRAPGSKLEEVFKTVRIKVMERTAGTQVPWESSSLTGDFYFAGQAAAAITPDRETLFWQSVQGSDNPAAIQAYLDRYPNGVFSVLARIRLEEISEQGGAVTKAPTKPSNDQIAAVTPPNEPPASQAKTPQAPTVQRERKKVEAAFRDCADCPEVVKIAAGSFDMGSPTWEKRRRNNEGPLHKVRLRNAFAIGVYEITRGEFAQFVRETSYHAANQCRTFENGTWALREGRSWQNPGFKQKDDEPAVCVAWRDAKAYVVWLSRKAGRSYRLPSEAEWEYAARAGNPGPYWFGESVDGGALCAHGNGAGAETGIRNRNVRCTDEYTQTAPVGVFAANSYGLHDVIGNVWEWVEDCGAPSYIGAPVDGSPAAFVTGGCKGRVYRGGGWASIPADLRSAVRGADAVVASRNELKDIPKFLRRIIVQIPRVNLGNRVKVDFDIPSSDRGFRVARPSF